MPEPVAAQSIEPDSDSDTVLMRTSTGASKRLSSNQIQNTVTKRKKTAPSLLHDETFAKVDEVSGTDTTTFDVNVLVKVAEARKRAGSKRIIPPVLQKLPVFFMDATTPFDSLLQHIANELKTSVVHLPMHTCEWKKRQSTNDSLPLKDQACFDAMKRGYKRNLNHSFFVTIDSPQIAPNPSPIQQPTERNADSPTELIQGSTIHDEVHFITFPTSLLIFAQTYESYIMVNIGKIKQAHKIGSCKTHPNIRCFQHFASQRHFELTQSRMTIMADNMVRKYQSSGPGMMFRFPL